MYVYAIGLDKNSLIEIIEFALRKIPTNSYQFIRHDVRTPKAYSEDLNMI